MWQFPWPDLLLCGVADGAGVAALADVGAQSALRSALEWASGRLRDSAPPVSASAWEALLRRAAHAAHETLLVEAAARDIEPACLATTLTLAAVTRESAACLQIGDGATVFEGMDGELRPLTSPLSGEYANETVFLTSEDADESAQFGYSAGPIRRFGLLTDGLQRLALRMTDGEPHRPFFLPLFLFAEENPDSGEAHRELERFLRSPRLRERTDDDLTLLIACAF